MSVNLASPVVSNDEYWNGKAFLKLPEDKFDIISVLPLHRHAHCFIAMMGTVPVVLKQLKIKEDDERLWEDFDEVQQTEVKVPQLELSLTSGPLKTTRTAKKPWWRFSTKEVPQPVTVITEIQPKKRELTIWEEIQAGSGTKINKELRKVRFKNVYGEIESLKLFNECEKKEFIVKYFGYFCSLTLPSARFIILGRCAGSLRSIVDSSPELLCTSFKDLEVHPLPIAVIYHLMAPIVDAVAFMHSEGWLHRDISDTNILLDYSGVPKLTDFGLALKVDLSEGPIKWERKYCVGHGNFIAPELIQGEDFDENIDCWGLVMTFMALVNGACPALVRDYSLEKLLMKYYKEGYYAVNRKGEDQKQMLKRSGIDENMEPLLFEELSEYGQVRFFEILGILEEECAGQNDKDWTDFRKLIKPFVYIKQELRPRLVDLLNSEQLAPYLLRWKSIPAACESEEGQFVANLVRTTDEEEL